MAFIEEGHEKSGTSHHESDKDEKSPNAAETQLRLAQLEAAADQGEDDEENGRRIRRIYRSVDLRLILTLAILYVWAYIDRGNLANANIAGMNKDLSLNIGNRYSILAMLFFVTYVVVDVPANIIIRKVGATIWMPSIVVAWGGVTIGQGFVHNWTPLLVCRLLLGLLEGGFIPGAMFLIGCWYTRYEAHKRLAAFYVVGITSTGLSGLLAFGIQNMDGASGLAGWRWIFIIEGSVTILVGLAAYFTLVDLPEKAAKGNLFGLPAFLSEEDAALVLVRIERDRGDSDAKPLTFASALYYMRDWKIWEFSLYLLLNNTASYAWAYFLPVILKQGFGYSTSKAQLFTFPPYAVAAPWMLICAWFCDKRKLRGPVLIFNSLLFIIGVSMTGFCSNNSARYAGVFLGVAGISANIPTQWAYAHNNTVGQPKKALEAAIMTTGGAIGGIVAGNVFRQQDSPDYIPGLSICMAFQVIQILLICKNFVLFTYRNRQADRGEVVIEGQYGFRYTL